MNASLLLLSSALMSGNPGPVVVGGAGCSGCGSAPLATPTFASASFGAAACGGCGTARVGLLDRLRGLFHRPASAGACGNSCGLPNCGTPACGTPACGTPLRSAFVAAHTACAAPSCGGPLLRSSFAVGSTGCCDPAPTARTGLFSRLRSRLSGSNGCGSTVAAPFATGGCGGCTATVGTVSVSPAGTAPVVMPPPPKDKPAEQPKSGKEPAKEKTSLTPAPVVPLIPSELPRIPTLGGASGE